MEYQRENDWRKAINKQIYDAQDCIAQFKEKLSRSQIPGLEPLLQARLAIARIEAYSYALAKYYEVVGPIPYDN